MSLIRLRGPVGRCGLTNSQITHDDIKSAQITEIVSFDPIGKIKCLLIPIFVCVLAKEDAESLLAVSESSILREFDDTSLFQNGKHFKLLRFSRTP